ncbi:hypothetical protein PROSTU_02173 [Providencia stuartii ATCC 25827]|uniref:Uncharacterized protein n=1 Tax=Providencia stuartii ATCC 25827 TaxID=471874 RepID=A0AA86YY44_PROST|nr:hypothetical protein PROSTU_02173 [Providencia stuartii ATCC 25827]
MFNRLFFNDICYFFIRFGHGYSVKRSKIPTNGNDNNNYLQLGGVDIYSESIIYFNESVVSR